MKEGVDVENERKIIESQESVLEELVDGAGDHKNALDAPITRHVAPQNENLTQRYYGRYFLIPAIFLTVALLGGMRLGSIDGSFIFLKPSLLCLVFASIMMVLFFRTGLIRLDGWLNETFTMRMNAANSVVLFSLFAGTTQLFNSLIPEQGLPFWIISFCFFWTLWNNLFADFDTKRLLRSLGALFGLAFVVKYLVLANLAAPADRNWLRGILESPGKQAMTWLLDIPQFSAATGYIQFFAVILFLVGLYLLPTSADVLQVSIPSRSRHNR
ncbi:hypothetical protein [Leptolyngbya sp. 7M]|uniref:hypothetical protein n=1 Tax=Leptolyngbya sp. 7M TaxID=2812896 RepID=UPI001B8C4D32|nr:hypothetical protein [Leptolyngbya sp. 7M]QYO68024.1 hypothetical protein JVX88_15355 [Leptolyngbya sp. 7M]